MDTFYLVCYVNFFLLSGCLKLKTLLVISINPHFPSPPPPPDPSRRKVSAFHRRILWISTWENCLKVGQIFHETWRRYEKRWKSGVLDWMLDAVWVFCVAVCVHSVCGYWESSRVWRFKRSWQLVYCSTMPQTCHYRRCLQCKFFFHFCDVICQRTQCETFYGLKRRKRFEGWMVKTALIDSCSDITVAKDSFVLSPKYVRCSKINDLST